MVFAVAEADERLENYARLACRSGSTSSRARRSAINALVEHAPLVRAIAREAYAAGARYVDVLYTDQHVRRAHIEARRRRTARLLAAVARRAPRRSSARSGGALCAITGNPEPELFADLDGERVGKARMREVAEASLRLTDGLCNWTIVAFPNEGWAQTVFGEPDVERLWQAVAHGRPARRARSGRRPGASTSTGSSSAPQALNERRFDPLRYRGPGTDLTIGLHPESEWQAALDESQRHQARREHADRGGLHDAGRTPRRGHGALDAAAADPGQRSCAASRCASRAAARSRCAPTSGEEVMRTHVATDDGAARLGEVALVDGHSRVGQTGLVFYDTLFDENASSHIALGASIVQAVAWAPRARRRRSAASAASTTPRSTPTS